MGTNGPRVFEDGQKIPVPKYSEGLKKDLCSTDAIDKKVWAQLNLETKKFYFTRGMNVTRKEDYGMICGAIVKKYPNIPLKTFQDKYSKSCNNRRNYCNVRPAHLNGNDYAGVEEELDEAANGAGAGKANVLEEKDEEEKEPEPIHDSIDPNFNGFVQLPEVVLDIPNLSGFRNDNIAVESVEEKDILLSSLVKISTPNPSCSQTDGMKLWQDISSVRVEAIGQSLVDTSKEAMCPPKGLICSVVALKRDEKNAEIRVISDETENSAANSNHLLLDLEPERRESFINPIQIGILPQDFVSSNAELTDFNILNKVHKRTTRSKPEPMSKGSDLSDDLRRTYLLHCNEVLNPEMVQMFKDTYAHRTIMIWYMSKDLLKEYPCLEKQEFLQMEVEEFYSKQEVNRLRENVMALVQAIKKYSDGWDLPYGLYNFFSEIKEPSSFILLTKEETQYENYLRDLSLSNEYPSICLLVSKEDRNIIDVNLRILNMCIKMKTLEDAMLYMITTHHALERQFPVGHELELKVLEAYVFGQLPVDVPEKIVIHMRELAKKFPELDTMNSLGIDEASGSTD